MLGKTRCHVVILSPFSISGTAHAPYLLASRIEPSYRSQHAFQRIVRQEVSSFSLVPRRHDRGLTCHGDGVRLRPDRSPNRCSGSVCQYPRWPLPLLLGARGRAGATPSRDDRATHDSPFVGQRSRHLSPVPSHLPNPVGPHEADRPDTARNRRAEARVHRRSTFAFGGRNGSFRRDGGMANGVREVAGKSGLEGVPIRRLGEKQRLLAGRAGSPEHGGQLRRDPTPRPHRTNLHSSRRPLAEGRTLTRR